ncbi:MAG: hypothetical protein CK423_07975 [Legionella sp.]|nr:MAG: hypothetical protein CK423_07975 [Legionella sp.]
MRAGSKSRRPISLDIEQRVTDLVKHGVTKAEISRQLNIGEASVYRILKRMTARIS